MAGGRGPGPRRLVLDGLKLPLERLQWIKSAWTVRSTVYLPPAERENNNVHLRPRQPHEYPENRRADWAMLHAQLTEAISELEVMRKYAAAQGKKATNA